MIRFKRFFSLAAILLAVSTVQAQTSDHPMLGAQIFIEPGQSVEQIESYFATMEQCGMEVGRIRMFGSHMLCTDGWDFSLYDAAFDAAERHHIKLFATLFPTTDELTDVGGFKYPSSKSHLAEIDCYVETVVEHFRHKPALWCWVLQNEPGAGSIVSPESSDLARELFASMPESTADVADNGYLKASFRNEAFTRHYTAWYLSHLAETVARIDPDHGRHINPHQILQTLPEYDFRSYENFLTSLGASMHLSWHFDCFERIDYPVGVALMSDIIASAAGRNPWWITEMQGGGVTASGKTVLCPTAGEIVQDLWIGIGSGAEGAIFWTLNQRRAAQEAGEWGLLDFNGRPTDRLEAIASVAAAVKAEQEFFAEAVPVKSDICLLYNKESFWIQARNASLSKDDIEGRRRTAVVKSLVAAYKALSANGISPEVADMDNFVYDPSKTVVLANTIAISDRQIAAITEFVRAGGRLIVTGMSGYYDPAMRCRFMESDEFQKCLGGHLSEFRIAEPYGRLNFDGLAVANHYWVGTITPSSGESMAVAEGRTIAVRNRYGLGETVWFPSMIDLGSEADGGTSLAEFYAEVCRESINSASILQKRPESNVLVRTLTNGSERLTIVINKSGEDKAVALKEMSNGRIAFGKGVLKNGRLKLAPEECVVIRWTER